VRSDSIWTLVLCAGLIVVVPVLIRWLAFLDHLRRHRMLLAFFAGLRHLPGAYRRAWGLKDELAYPTVVPAGPDGRPGERLMGPSQSAVAGRMQPDDSRADCQILVGPKSYVMVACLGRVEDRGDAWASARQVCANPTFQVVLHPCPSTMAGLPAVLYTVSIGRRRLTERKFERDGWLFVAGFLRPPNAAAGVDRLARATLDSWTWLEDPAGVG
jgi:hypothetical protein